MSGAAARLRAGEMRLARHFGAAGSLVKRTATYNPATLQNAFVEVQHEVAALIVQRRRQWDPEAGRMVQLQAEQAVIPADALPAGVVPDADDHLVVGGATYSITEIEKRGPAPSPRSYVCAIVRAAS